MISTTPRRLALLALAGTLAACSGSGTAPTAKTQVTFSLSSKALGASPSRGAFLSDTVSGGGATLVLDSVQLVLRDLRFKRVEDGSCPDDDSASSSMVHANGGNDGSGHEGNGGHEGDDNGGDGQHDACESFNAGPFLLDVPLGGGVDRAFSVVVDTGTYDQLRIKIHKPRSDSGDPKDIAFLAAHPEFEKVSIRAVGSYNGAPFTFTTDLDVEQRIALVPPIAVADSATNVDVTIKVDVSNWFSDGAGGLVDPATGLKGGANDHLVRNNIEDSFHAFRDGNHDGHDDDGSDDD
jgi:hypothetical protein